LQSIRSLGVKAGVAINPGTPVHALDAVLSDADLFLVMSVNPGFGGQKFIPATYDKVRQLRDLLDACNPDALIEVDGGVGPQNSAALFEAGANVLVAGNAVFKDANPREAIRLMKEV
jgi:ribulose-phosphate 3-epimerase